LRGPASTIARSWPIRPRAKRGSPGGGPPSSSTPPPARTKAASAASNSALTSAAAVASSTTTARPRRSAALGAPPRDSTPCHPPLTRTRVSSATQERQVPVETAAHHQHPQTPGRDFDRHLALVVGGGDLTIERVHGRRPDRESRASRGDPQLRDRLAARTRRRHGRRRQLATVLEQAD